MKPSTGPTRPRRATPKVAAKKPGQVRLNLKRAPKPPAPEELLERRQKGHFWRWVAIVTLLHIAIIAAAAVWLAYATQIKPPEEFISLLPQGDVVKGNPGLQEAHKVGPTTAAHIAHHAASPPPTSAPALPKSVAQPPEPKPDANGLEKPVVKPPTPKPPKHEAPKPKVKVDLHLQDGPTPPADKPKPKLHAKKPTLRPDDTDDAHDADTQPDSTGLSREEIAAKLGEKLDAPGVKDAVKTGQSGSENGHANDFSSFYAMVRDQVMSNWTNPNLADETAVNPVVEIYVEKDGRVPPESVKLRQSSGNATYDDSAVAAAKSLGYLREPLPDGCNPVITISFKLTR